MKKSLILAASLSLLASGVAFAGADSGAQHGHTAQNAPDAKPAPTAPAIGAHIRARFHKLDRNRDGYIDAKEARHLRSLHREFKHVARSGRMNEAEFAAWEKRRMERHTRMDKRKHVAAAKEKRS
ncbi:MAG TPA: hypothetical protein VKA76_00895 [Gammaproteobacteria bacterium]|nr:hypothetical protein [Gammaproteobacteria bacterium]